MIKEEAPWWQRGIVYQIYPRSFQDSNGDGIGDLAGIISRLEYVKSLNVDAIWISPIFPSPMHDFGYDVSDYIGIHPIFGTMGDFDRLLARAHELGLTVLLDLVPNHTSDEHPWFLESRASRTNPKRGWYFWRDPAPDGGPPNNWLSCFGGSAWEWDASTGQYYLHTFARQQPDLDFRNPEVLAAMLDAMRFWLEKGVDGFRVDVITGMIKDADLRDEPENPGWDGVEPYARLSHIYSSNLPEVHSVIRQMRALIDSYPGRVLIGEIYALPNEELVKYYGATQDECHLPFNFGLIWIPWKPEVVRQTIQAYLRALPPTGWPNWVLGNHDQPRIATRAGQAQVGVANMLLLTLRGTPTVYQGEEIGMENVAIPLALVQDPPAVNQPEIAHLIGRDPQRTPMQWDGSPNAGFSDPGACPWLPLADDFSARNVARQEQDPCSPLALFRALTALRRREPALSLGDMSLVESGVEDVIAFTRSRPGVDRFLVALNLGGSAHVLDFSRLGDWAKLALDTGLRRTGRVDLARLELGPNEGLLLRLSGEG